MSKERRLVLNAMQDKADGFGVSTMIRELYSEYTAITERKCTVIVSRDNRNEYGNERTETVRVPIGDRNSIKRILFLSFRMGFKYCRNADLLTSDAQIPFLLPRSTKVFPLVTDLSMFRRPRDFPLSKVLLWKMQYGYLKRRGEVFLAISEFTKREMIEILHIPADRIHVVHCACPKYIQGNADTKEKQRIRSAYSLSEQYLLFMGNENRRKNVERLILAFARFCRETKLSYTLVIAGAAARRKDIRQLIAQERIQGICLIDYVPREDLPGLLSGAAAYVYLSLYEGFGIPILEAQKCGIPILAAQGSALRETGGDGAIYVDPESIDRISEGIKRILLEDALRNELIRYGFENEKRFSWGNSARIVRNVIEKRHENCREE